MQIQALIGRWALWSARIFPQRDIILRSNDKVRHLRIRPWQQKLAATGCIVLGAWLLVANLGLLWQGHRVAARDFEIAQRQLAYLDLMEEVSGYQRQFSRIAEGLYSDQTQLLARIGARFDDDLNPTVVGEGDARRTEAAGQVALARETLRERLSGFEGDLRQVARQSESLRARVDDLRADLSSTRQERQAVAAARRELGARLEETQELLAAERAVSLRLRDRVAALQAGLARGKDARTALLETQDTLRAHIGGLEQEVVRLSSEREALATLVSERNDELAAMRTEVAAMTRDRDRLATDLERERRAHLSTLAAKAVMQADLDGAVAAHGKVAAQRAALREDLARLRDDFAAREAALRVAALRERDLARGMAATAARLDESRLSLAGSERENKALRNQVAALGARIETMGAGQEALMARYRALANDTIGTFEKTITMTGLDVQDLMASLDEQFVPRGGPFISETQEPRDDWSLLPYLDADGDPISLGPTSLEVSMTNLDLQLDRWEGLQDLLRAIPLAPPLEEYDITSSYGFRYDPVNGRKARHEGTDFAAPPKTSIYSTAAGKVVYAGWKGHYGRVVEIDHGHGIRTRYAHMRSILVKRGERVGNRQKIGLVGSSGRATGPHLHYEVLYHGQAVDPQKFLLAGKNVFKE